MTKKGESLQLLVANLERSLSQNKDTKIESPKYIKDVITGKLREHDVLLSTKINHYDLKIAIECRDRSRPITVNQVESFYTKCRDTKIEKGVIVSSTGFSKQALEKASFYGIQCLRIEEVNSFNWLLAPNLRMLTFVLLASDWKFIPEVPDLIDNNNFEIINAQDSIISRQNFTNVAQQILNRIRSKYSSAIAETVKKFQFVCEDLFLRDVKSGEKVRAKSVIVSIKFSIKEDSIPFAYIEYTKINETISEKIIDAAIVDLDDKDFTGKLIITNNKNEGFKIIFLPEKK